MQVNGEIRDPSVKLDDNPDNARALNMSKFMESLFRLAVALLPKGACGALAWRDGTSVPTGPAAPEEADLACLGPWVCCRRRSNGLAAYAKDHQRELAASYLATGTVETFRWLCWTG